MLIVAIWARASQYLVCTDTAIAYLLNKWLEHSLFAGNESDFARPILAFEDTYIERTQRRFERLLKHYFWISDNSRRYSRIVARFQVIHDYIKDVFQKHI